MDITFDQEYHGCVGGVYGSKDSFRRFMFTAFGPFNWTLQDDVSFIVFQHERTPTTQRDHYQCYIELKRTMRIPGLKKLLGLNNMHCDVARGTREQCIAYVTKERTRVAGPWIVSKDGQLPEDEQGKRKDIDRAKEIIEKTGSLDKVIEECGTVYIKYHKGLEAYQHKLAEIKSGGPRHHPMEVFWLWGDSDSGKTRWVFDTFGVDNIYKKDFDGKDDKWFDGYMNEPVLLIDDIDPEVMTYRRLLTLLDRYKTRIQYKGGSKHFNSHVVVITSNDHPMVLYQQKDMWPLIRRITKGIYHIKHTDIRYSNPLPSWCPGSEFMFAKLPEGIEYEGLPEIVMEPQDIADEISYSQQDDN